MSRRKCLELIETATSVKDYALEGTECGIFHELGVEIVQKIFKQAIEKKKT